ncbi:DNA-directed RNA polymerase II core subunit rpo21 [Marasmius tenuissimus]|uniref:DNA-directed RNA polymerase n=1 Tax=Marasmius tenuissimus TaxID=585030 RepID=A0ABR2ZD37_9AGAR
MHVSQSKETQAELSQVAWVPRQIISPQANKPVMGIVQDTLCGIRKNILLWVPEWDGVVPIPAILKPKPLWTGKQILSLVISRGINILRSPDPKSSSPIFDDGTMIENGEVIFGVVKKDTVGASQSGLIHVMVVNFWLFHNGFSIGIGDTIADTGTMSFTTKTIAESKANVA